jgi:succinate dehydrogenase flavin-adding protein (antitoxin of CptAB toxin-antitoxin module)
MLSLNKEFLESIGVHLDDETQKALSEHYDTTLSDRVTTEIVEELGDEQLRELQMLKDASDEELQAWLVTNVPELNEIIEDEVAILLGEIAENSDKLS